MSLSFLVFEASCWFEGENVKSFSFRKARQLLQRRPFSHQGWAVTVGTLVHVSKVIRASFQFLESFWQCVCFFFCGRGGISPQTVADVAQRSTGSVTRFLLRHESTTLPSLNTCKNSAREKRRRRWQDTL